MAKRTSTTKAKAENGKAARPSEVRPAISAGALKELMRTARSAYKDQREIAGELGQAIANAVEHKHLHRKAFAVVRAADRMTPEKLAEFIDCLDHYFDISGLNERAASAPRLALNGAGKDEGEDEGRAGEAAGPETAQPAKNVRPFPQPAAQQRE